MKESEHSKFRVAFSAIFDLTETYYQLSRRMDDEIDSFFITSVQATYRRLLALGVPESRILNVARTRGQMRAMGEPGPELRARIDEFERYGPSFSSIILMSRFYKGEDSASLMHYMATTAVRMEEFFQRNGIQCVIAEPTSAVELLSAPVARKNNILFASPGFARLPHNRIVMFSDEEERAFYRLASGKDGDGAEERARREAIEWIKRYREAPARPAYFASQTVGRSLTKSLMAGLRHAKQFVDGMTGGDELNDHRFTDLVQLHGRPYLGWVKRRIIQSRPELHWDAAQPYAALFLHVCPERSVDVVASWFSNQLEVIRTIRRALPSRFALLIKEHPSATGAQTLEFYKQLSEIPNLTLLNARVDSRELMRGAELVFTISGTAALEAALLGTPAIIFCNVFFARLPLVKRCTSPEQLPALIGEAVESARTTEDPREVDFLADILLNSVESGWNGACGILPETVIDSFAELLMRTLTHELRQGNLAQERA